MASENDTVAPAQTVITNLEHNKKVMSKTSYAITITFKYLHCKSPRAQFYECAPFLTKLLSRSTTFSIMPEWRHTTGDIHFHGIVIIVDMIKWLKQTLPSLKRLGFILLKIIKEDYKEGWIKYIDKERYIAEGILPAVPLPLESELLVVKQKDIKKNVVMDDYILECLSE